MRKLNIAYVGFGKSTNRYHIPYVKQRENFNIARIVTPHLGKRPEEAELAASGTIFSTDIADIINDDTLDLVVVVTPAKFHYETAKQLLLAGKNVLCDKPLVETLEEAKELVKIAQEKNVFFMPFQNRRFDSDFLTVKKVIETGYLGDIIDITVNMDHFRPDDAGQGTNFDGAWYGHGVHLVDQMIALFGKPEKVQYDIRATRDENAVDDYFSVNLLYPKHRATVAASELVALPHAKWIVYGTRGTFIKQNVDQQENDLKVGIMPGTDGFGLDSPQDFGQLVYYNQNGDKIKKTIPTVAGDYGRVYDSVYETLVNTSDKLVSDEQILTVIESLENGFIQ
ncbi:oxidoreductase [Lactococcus nasutitermitis]|uniref:Oxidoreductase n=1 Tax=Lactococcus nasutitermitis TaxID=1652957 RepID=A0ABV9JG68_9LACT|nr:oxidoreductase [Lactococcus nasutitermitis]